MGRPATDKRQRLVASAIERFHHRGYAQTSLADVANNAGIPPGNVFYYFKSKDELAKAAVDEWCLRSAEHAKTLETADGWTRLEQFIEQASEMREMYVTNGCPLAGLARDLRHESKALQDEVPRIYDIQLQWVQAQFDALGFAPAQSEQHTRLLMAGYHGAVQLAYAQQDGTIITSAETALKAWLQQLRESQVR